MEKNMENEMETGLYRGYIGGQNYGPFLGTLNIRGRIIIGVQKGTTILTNTHMLVLLKGFTQV